MDPYAAGAKRPGATFDMDPKRQKMGASKVLHVRGLPFYSTEAEIVNLVAPFAQVVKTLILHDKNQAFVELPSIQAAENVIAGLEFTQPQIRSKAVYFQFSNRQEIEIGSAPGVGGGVGGMGGGGEMSSVLILAISNVTVPVTLENVHQVCKPYGEVLKIITFNKGMDYQALVQFASMEQATNAKMFLDGKDLFQGCCHLRISYSKRQNLIVKQNDHKSRDFTVGGGMPNMQNSLMGGMPGGMGGGGMPGGMPGMGQMGGMPPQMGGMPGMGGQAGPTAVVLVNKLDETNVTPQVLFTLFGVYGDVIRVKILYNKRDTAMIQFANSQQATYAQQNLNGCPLFGQNILVSKSKHLEVKLPRENDGQELTQDFTGHEAHRFKQKNYVNQKNVNAPSQVLHIANIHQNTTDEELLNLFHAQAPNSAPPVIEFFKTNRAMAYVGMASIDEAVMALINLHNQKLHEYPLRVSFSHKDYGKLEAAPVAVAAVGMPEETAQLE